MNNLVDNIIKRKNTISFSAAKDISITMVNAILSNLQLPIIPNEYKDFLKVTNGIITSSYNFYGTEIVKQNDLHYINISDINNNFKKLFNNFKSLVIGETLLNIIIYNGKKYQIINNFTLQPLQEFNDFITLLTYLEQ